MSASSSGTASVAFSPPARGYLSGGAGEAATHPGVLINQDMVAGTRYPAAAQAEIDTQEFA